MATFNARTKVWSLSPRTPLYNQNANLGQILIACLDLAGERVAQIHRKTRTTSAAKEVATRAAAGGLRAAPPLDVDEGYFAQLLGKTGTKVTAKEVRSRAIRAAQRLQEQGVTEGDILGIAARTLENVPAILYAGLLLGAPVNTLDPEFSQGEVFGFFCGFNILGSF